MRTTRRWRIHSVSLRLQTASEVPARASVATPWTWQWCLQTSTTLKVGHTPRGTHGRGWSSTRNMHPLCGDIGATCSCYTSSSSHIPLLVVAHSRVAVARGAGPAVRSKQHHAKHHGHQGRHACHGYPASHGDGLHASGLLVHKSRAQARRVGNLCGGARGGRVGK